MPPDGLPTISRPEYLSVAEIARFAEVAARLGVERIRLTGGEPLLRPEVIEITQALKQINGVRELSMTTNASLLGRFAKPLREAGLDRLNISLDSLDGERFGDITRSKMYKAVLDGIHTALDIGFPVKLNVVVISGMPDDEIIEFVSMAIDHDIDVRFLEFMPLCGSGWEADRVYAIGEVRNIVAARFTLTELDRADQPAQTFSIDHGRGRVGFIAPLSEPFCGQCSRMRLTADGKIRPCLFSNDEYSIGHLLKSGVSDNDLADAIRHAVLNKVWGSEFADKPFRTGETHQRDTQSSPFIRSIGG